MSDRGRPRDLPPPMDGAISLVEQLDCEMLVIRGDEQVLVILRDGKQIRGTLRTFDQYSNVALEGAVLRTMRGKYYSDTSLGLYMVRGDQVQLVAEVDPAVEGSLLGAMRKVKPELVEELAQKDAHEEAAAAGADEGEDSGGAAAAALPVPQAAPGQAWAKGLD